MKLRQRAELLCVCVCVRAWGRKREVEAARINDDFYLTRMLENEVIYHCGLTWEGFFFFSFTARSNL